MDMDAEESLVDIITLEDYLGRLIVRKDDRN